MRPNIIVASLLLLACNEIISQESDLGARLPSALQQRELVTNDLEKIQIIYFEDGVYCVKFRLELECDFSKRVVLRPKLFEIPECNEAMKGAFFKKKFFCNGSAWIAVPEMNEEN